MRRLVGLALLPAALSAGCSELTQPPQSPPAALAAVAADPLRAAVDEVAAAFVDRGANLDGRPIDTAEAAARLEYLADALPADPRYARSAAGVVRELALARDEVRDALGIAADAPSPVVSAALLRAASRLRASDRAGAAVALPAPTFRPGGIASVARLSEIGPLPQAAIATTYTRQVVARIDSLSYGGSTQLPETTAGLNGLTTDFGSPLAVGY